jgi:hypothetical protein
MSDAERIDSPDRRYSVVLVATEMRMSHWIMSAVLWERASQRLLLQIGGELWSSEEITWSADSLVVTVGLRRYPGDAPGLVVDIYAERRIVVPRASVEMQPLSFADLNTFLEQYYAQHRRSER